MVSTKAFEARVKALEQKISEREKRRSETGIDLERQEKIRQLPFDELQVFGWLSLKCLTDGELNSYGIDERPPCSCKTAVEHWSNNQNNPEHRKAAEEYEKKRQLKEEAITKAIQDGEPLHYVEALLSPEELRRYKAIEAKLE